MAGAGREASRAFEVTLAEEVRAALAAHTGVVALESTVIAHGLPWPHNLEVARDMERAVRAAGAVPATVAVLDGTPTVGISAPAMERLARSDAVAKASARDLSFVCAQGLDGATTVAGTLAVASLAGLDLMATGGIGGVHRGYEATADASADILALARYPVAVVASGAKSILDLPRTLEHLETAGVSVVGYGTDRFPAFYCAGSELALDWRVDGVDQAAVLVDANAALALGGLLLANPVPAAQALERERVETWIAEALAESGRRAVHGKSLTPFLLAHLASASGGATLVANKALLVANASLAGRIAARRGAG